MKDRLEVCTRLRLKLGANSSQVESIPGRLAVLISTNSWLGYVVVSNACSPKHAVDYIIVNYFLGNESRNYQIFEVLAIKNGNEVPFLPSQSQIAHLSGNSFVEVGVSYPSALPMPLYHREKHSGGNIANTLLSLGLVRFPDPRTLS